MYKYLDLTCELKKLFNMRMIIITIVILAIVTISKNMKSRLKE